MGTVFNAVALFAQEAHDETPVGAVFTVSATLIAFVAAVVIPFLTGLLTKLGARPLVKQVVAGVLSVATAVVNAAVTNNGVAVISWNTVLLAVLTFAGQLLVYIGLLKPNDTVAKVIPDSLHDKGLGRAA